MRVGTLALFTLLVCGCFASRDMENVCNAEQKAGTSSVADPAERATRTAQWLQDNIRTATVKKEVGALGVIADRALKARIIRQMALEHGYKGPCPSADALELSAPAAPLAPPPVLSSATSAPLDPAEAHRQKMKALYAVGEEGRARELRASHQPIRAASEELTIHGEQLYGRALPTSLGFSNDPAPLAETLPKLGCTAKLTKKLHPFDKKAAVLMKQCAPIGPALLARNAVARDASVGRATLAMLIESLASPEMKRSPVHEALVAAMLGPAKR